MAQKLNTTTSIVDYLKSIGQDSSLANRSKLAKEQGIEGYTGSGDQNTALLQKLSGGAAPSTYAGEVKDQLKEYDATPKTGSNTKDTGGDLYDSSKIKADVDTYKTKMDDAFQKLKTVQTETYNTEYEKRGLSAKKEKIASLDSEIATAKKERDDAIAKVRSNPGLSAAQMAGDVKKLADYQNNVINNKIEERNSVANEYNGALAEIDKIAGRASEDAKNEYAYYSGLLNRADTQLSNYQKTLLDTLKEDQQQSNWEKELAQALEIAQIKAADTGGKSTRTLVRDPRTGDPLYWYDSASGDISWIDDSSVGGSGGGNTSFDDIKVDEPAANENKPGWFSNLVSKLKFW